MSKGQGATRVLVGFVVLHVLCCGVPLLIAAGALGGAGALLGNPVLLVGGATTAVAAVMFAVRRRGGGAPRCCPPTELRGPSAGSSVAEPRKAHR